MKLKKDNKREKKILIEKSSKNEKSVQKSTKDERTRR